MNKLISNTIANLNANNMETRYIESMEQLYSYIEDFIKDKDVVSVGGSQTLFELGIIEYLRTRDITFLDRYQPGLSSVELKKIFREAFFANVYLASANAITEDGYLYYVDGRANRTAAILYGPDKVLIIAGENKIVRNIDEAIERVRSSAAPLNAARLNLTTPCVRMGICADCDNHDKICRNYVLIKKPIPHRIYVLIVNKNLGF